MRAVVSGGFDDLRYGDVRLLQEASRVGPVEVALWAEAPAPAPPFKFPLEERKYLLEAIRFVDRVTVTDPESAGELPKRLLPGPAIWIVAEGGDTAARRDFCRRAGLELRPMTDVARAAAPGIPDGETGSGRPQVMVTGCYDWFHSGHVRFFEEVSALGDLTVVVGNDRNVELLKGKGHPMFSEDVRCYLVHSVRHVCRARIATGSGWLDAEPEIRQLRPDIYAVNEDGDRPEKRRYCETHGIDYRVLLRRPREGLPRRQSTTLRGF
jgi:cytidyltransferase-like protein